MNLNTLLKQVRAASIIAGLLFAFHHASLAVCGQNSKPEVGLSEAQWNELYKSVENEDWSAAAKTSAQYLKEKATEDDLARLRYILIFANAAKTAERKMTYEELEKEMTLMLGKDIALPPLPVANRTPCPMATICPSAESKKRVSVAATNSKGTYIFAFQYFELKNDVDLSRPDLGDGSLSGMVRGFQLNPNKSTIWIMRLYIERGELTFN